MRLALQVPSFTWPGGPEQIGPTFKRIAVEAEQAGLAGLWVMDHFFQIRGVGPAEDPMIEGYTALAYAAAVTERIELGTLVTGVTYRHPGVLIKTVTSLDVLSGGRAWLGIGAAWNDEEHRGLGVPYPPTAERFERLEETLRIGQQMWSGERGDETPFEGKHYQLERPMNSPQSISRPHPKIMIGGGGEKKTLRLVAQYADACNLFGEPDAVTHKLEVLRQHCADVGRDYEAIEKTVLATVVLSDDGAGDTETVEAAAERLAALGQAGVQQTIVNNMTDIAAPGALERYGLLVEKIAAV
jgi:F420-dependent oxidoreductase-like protein